jgi:hypothetical protein
MVKLALLVRLEAKPGKEAAVSDFLATHCRSRTLSARRHSASLTRSQMRLVAKPIWMAPSPPPDGERGLLTRDTAEDREGRATGRKVAGPVRGGGS